MPDSNLNFNSELQRQNTLGFEIDFVSQQETRSSKKIIFREQLRWTPRWCWWTSKFLMKTHLRDAARHVVAMTAMMREWEAWRDVKLNDQTLGNLQNFNSEKLQRNKKSSWSNVSRQRTRSSKIINFCEQNSNDQHFSAESNEKHQKIDCGDAIIKLRFNMWTFTPFTSRLAGEIKWLQSPIETRRQIQFNTLFRRCKSNDIV